MRLKRRDFLLLSGLAGFGLSRLWGYYTQRQETYDRAATASTAQSPEPVTSSTPAIARKPPRLRFVAFADNGSGDRDQDAVGEAMARYHRQNPYSLVVLAGDNIYNNGEIEKIKIAFEQPYQALLQQGVKFRACLGNHDIRTENGEPQLRYPGYNMQGRYYTYREKTAQFFVLDTNSNADWNRQLAWLEQELSRSNALWKIVYGHHPIYSSGRYGTNAAFVNLLTPLFKKYGVQLYINGHEHDYERTQPIDGTTYLITGIGGAALRPVGRSEWTAFSTSQFGFSALEVYDDRMEIQGIGTDDQVFDRGTILMHRT